MTRQESGGGDGSSSETVDAAVDSNDAGSTTLGWSAQNGPGFTVVAPGAPNQERVAANDGVPAFERYIFYKDAFESYVVEVTEFPADKDLGMMMKNMRMRITSQTQAVRAEDMIEGEVTGYDIWYVVEVGERTLRARSKLLGQGRKIFEARAIWPDIKERETLAEKFVDSFTLAP